MIGWIKIHRKILHSDMYRSLNSKQRDVLITCLLLANHTENEWEFDGSIFKCKPGQFVTSLQKISDFCGKDVKVQSVRTSLLKLEKWGFLTNKSTKANRVITICKWDTYQQKEKSTNNDDNSQPTNDQQTTNKDLTTNKNEENLSNNEKEEKSEILDFEFPEPELKPESEAIESIPPDNGKGKPLAPKNSEPNPLEEKEKAELVDQATKAISKFFNISEQINSKSYMEIGRFVQHQSNMDKIGTLRAQFRAYETLKLIDGFKHSFQKYIGTTKEKYLDGVWCEKDWVLELQEKKNAPKKPNQSFIPETPTRLPNPAPSRNPL